MPSANREPSPSFLAIIAFVTNTEVEAIVGGYHGDPFRILGPHLVESTGEHKAGWEVCAFLPQAESAELLLNGKPVPMEKRHPYGLFSASVPTEPDGYRLRLRTYAGDTQVIDDPYRFPPVLTDFELHLQGVCRN